jgi:hypothetical protein
VYVLPSLFLIIVTWRVRMGRSVSLLWIRCLNVESAEFMEITGKTSQGYSGVWNLVALRLVR